MAQCANCGRTILFGGPRLGEHRFCGARCFMVARPSLTAPGAGDVRDVEDEVRELRDDLMMLAEDLDKDRVAQGELSERLDFLERTMVQLRDELRRTGGGQAEPPGETSLETRP